MALQRLSGARHPGPVQEARAPAAPIALTRPLVQVAAAVHALIVTPRPWRPMTPARLQTGGLDARVPRAERGRDHPRRRPALLEPGSMPASVGSVRVHHPRRFPAVRISPRADLTEQRLPPRLDRVDVARRSADNDLESHRGD